MIVDETTPYYYCARFMVATNVTNYSIMSHLYKDVEKAYDNLSTLEKEFKVEHPKERITDKSLDVIKMYVVD